ncbi:unnamed protein product [Acanthoscelides obtectus]|uniref:SMP-30/Gluconolactonase/LRE-like region domain-containing protein n=1 Tax=Acanthoscelides obtectus TaxID=200917 RepID=A0A9P0K4D3_ACAOB|nr:unnamed protein product [Acanthoscelides obtectus]CAK1643763.1 Regucalcin [Acanthoscelides obtectus]
MSKWEIKPITQPLDVGTRIHWDKCNQSAIFVDVPNGTVHSFKLSSCKVTTAKVGDDPIAFMFPVEGSGTKFVAGLGKKFVFVEWDSVSPQVASVDTIVEVETEPEYEGNRLNGGKVDPWGRLWAGTMGPPGPDGNIMPRRGALYCLANGQLQKHECNIGISNGLAWNTELKKMYYIDTLEPCVFQYDIADDARISNKTVVFDFKKNHIEGLPDGLTIDVEGCLWVCAIHGYHLIRFDPKCGHILDKIELPTPQITAVSFGGPNLDLMFVTTARIPINGTPPPDPAGTTYLLSCPDAVRGYPGDSYKL